MAVIVEWKPVKFLTCWYLGQSSGGFECMVLISQDASTYWGLYWKEFFRQDVPPVLVNFEMLSVHLLDFIVIEKIS